MNFDSTHIPAFDLQRHHSQLDVPQDLNLRDLARKHKVFPLRVISWNGSDELLLAMTNPKNLEAIQQVEAKTGKKVIPVQAESVDVQWLIQKYYYGCSLTPHPSLRPLDFNHELFEKICSQEN